MRAPFALVLAPFAVVLIGLGYSHPQAAQSKTTAAVENPHISKIPLRADPNVLFKPSGDCMPCHNSLTTPSGEDVSIGVSWRATMMANASKDPYWQAGVRRETIDHPTATADIQDECSICHMPMATSTAHANGKKGEVFAHLPIGQGSSPQDLLAYDGVSCTLCHQISTERLGTPESFVGGFVIAGRQPGQRPVYGPFEVDKNLTTVMQSSAEFQPTQGEHIRQSEVCATCHTLLTKALNSKGEVIGELPEQVMYLEWKHSAFLTEQKSCQSCHMPPVEEEMPITSVLGKPRQGLGRHTFVGGNFFMLGILNRFRTELGADAQPQEFAASIARTLANLQTQTANVAIEKVETAGGRLDVDVAVQNLSGHKLPTAYPSRRAWLHVTVRDRAGKTVFESGAIKPSGLIEGNDNDADATKFEPHYTEVRQPDQVQIYESVMGDSANVPTTGLLTATQYLKDNRLLPRGFDKMTADSNVKVVGGALQDPDFGGGSDRTRYSIGVAGSEGPFQVDVELRFQPIGFRWAENLKSYDAFEPKRFVGYYQSMSAASSTVLAHATAKSQ